VRYGFLAGLAFVLSGSFAIGAAETIEVSSAARSMQPGELLVLTAKLATPIDALNVRVFDRPAAVYQVGPTTWQALVGIDLAVRPGHYSARIGARSGDRTFSRITGLVVRARAFPTRKLRVDDAFVNPSPDVMERIRRESKKLEDQWMRSAGARLWSGPFVPPVVQNAVGRFGARSFFNGQPRAPHSGDDFPSPEGTPVHAPNAGRVVLAEHLYFTGNTVVIDHGLGLFSLLAHLSTLTVREGDSLMAGDLVGRVGATGRVTGPHLHWAVRLNGARIDPLSLLALLGRDRT
jgi:murein DD-endopeptidase MepM/ murein hydrolase activator NlpD